MADTRTSYGIGHGNENQRSVAVLHKG